MRTHAIEACLQRQIKHLIAIIIIGLVISGLTAFPIQYELDVAYRWIEGQQRENIFSRWITFVYEGVHETYAKYPFVAYGTDWLAFAHLVIAIAFIGPLRDPVKNVWVIEWGLIACLGILPLALIAGPIRGIPLVWQLIDCSFGVVAGIILLVLYRKIRQLMRLQVDGDKPELISRNV